MATPISITIEELKSFHKIDRELYGRLLTNLNHEPIESMQIIALWLWLEQVGFPNIVTKMLNLSDSELNTIKQEAVACLKCLSSSSPPMPNNINIPMTQTLLEKTISLRFFHENRSLAVTGIAKIVNDVCVRTFDDIAQEAMAKSDEDVLSLPLRNTIISTGGTDVSESRVGNLMVYPEPLLGPGLLHPVYQHPLMVQTETSPNSGSNLNPQAEPYNPNPNDQEQVPQDDRTMFVTFSRGYPMEEQELIEFFTTRYGDCIEEMHMQEVPPNTQSLFGRIVLYSSSKITEILNGNERVKFIINGKHIWVRRYEVRQGRRPPRTVLGPAAVGPRGSSYRATE